jgi:hypothetical protein
MAFRAGRLAGGRNQDEFRLSHLFSRRRRRLWEVSLRSGVSSCFLLRVHGLLKSVVMRPNLVSVVEVSSVEELKQMSKSTWYSQIRARLHEK